MSKKGYLAGPFFNPAQLELVQAIETLAADRGVALFSPRQSDFNKKNKFGPPRTRAQCLEIYNDDVEELHDSDWMLAVIDWKLPEGLVCQLMKYDYDRDLYEIHESGPLNLPDTGTVFEVGYFTALQHMESAALQASVRRVSSRNIVLYSDFPAASRKLNLMLTIPAKGILHGREQLAKFFSNGNLDWDVLTPWEGEHE